nr:MAG TPA: hypothetical protein [Caudoviricetes sp.]
MFPCFRVLIILYMNPWKSQVAQATLIHVCMENILYPKKCSLPDTLNALQPRYHPDLPRVACLVSSADRCSVSSVGECMGLSWFLRRSGALVGLGSPPLGYMGRAGGGGGRHLA